MRTKQTIINVTHEFVEDPEGVRQAYDTWALLLARSLNVAAPAPIAAVRSSRRHTRKHA